MKLILLTISLFIANVAQADIIRCTFTEPFVNSTYSMTQSKLTYFAYDDKTTEFKNVSFQIKGPGLFELVAKDGTVLQKLTLSFKGSDGMSDNTFPFEVEDSTMSNGANNGVGGCYSNYLPIKGEEAP